MVTPSPTIKSTKTIKKGIEVALEMEIFVCPLQCHFNFALRHDDIMVDGVAFY
jgi:hypothetical protein